MVTSPGLGVLGEKITEAHTKIIPIKNGFAEFNEKIRLPLTPMIGVLGVAPAEGSVHCAVPGDHGSNMDTKLIKVGSKVYLPVFVSGANLALGDLHACMGDGELSGTGIETAGQSMPAGGSYQRPEAGSVRCLKLLMLFIRWPAELIFRKLSKQQCMTW